MIYQIESDLPAWLLLRDFFTKGEYDEKEKILIVLIIMARILVIGIPYINVEIKTYKYGDQFKDRYTDTNMITGIEYYKVFSYSETKAKVLYVELGHETVNFVWFKKEKGKWMYDNWETIWSQNGSADGWTFPFYR